MRTLIPIHQSQQTLIRWAGTCTPPLLWLTDAPGRWAGAPAMHKELSGMCCPHTDMHASGARQSLNVFFFRCVTGACVEIHFTSTQLLSPGPRRFRGSLRSGPCTGGQRQSGTHSPRTWAELACLPCLGRGGTHPRRACTPAHEIFGGVSITPFTACWCGDAAMCAAQNSRLLPAKARGRRSGDSLHPNGSPAQTQEDGFVRRYTHCGAQLASL